MKRYRLWALDVPDLHPQGFQPRLGGMRLFEGGDGGGGDGGDGTTAGIDAPASASSSADASTGFSYGGGEGGDPFSYYDPYTGTYTNTPAPVTVEEVLGLPQEDEAGLKEIIDYVKDLLTTSPTPVAPTTPAPTTTTLASAPNIVGTGAGGILVDSEGNPVLSTSYGLPGEYTPPSPQLPADTLAAAAAARGMTVNQLREVVDAEQQSGAPLSTTGLDYGTLEAMQNAGLGGLEISPTQTVDQALASKEANEFLTDYLPTILSAVGFPGVGAIGSIKTINQLLTGQTTPGQAITTELLGALARQFGVPPTVLTNILDGKFGDAAANQTKSLIYGTLAKESGVPGSVLGIMARELGITDAIDPLATAVDTAVTDVVPDQGFGIPGQVASGIDTVLDPVQEAITSGLGGLGDVLQEAGQGIASGVGTVTTGIGDLIGDLVNAITGGGAGANANTGTGSVVDESGPGGTDVSEEVLGDYVVDESGPGGTDVSEEVLGDYVVDESGPGGTDAGTGVGTGVDTGGAGGDTDVAAPAPPPTIPATGGGTTQMFGNYYSRVPTGYQIVQGPYGPLMQYTYGNVALGGV